VETVRIDPYDVNATKVGAAARGSEGNLDLAKALFPAGPECGPAGPLQRTAALELRDSGANRR
jgi:hypothetical protein